MTEEFQQFGDIFKKISEKKDNKVNVKKVVNGKIKVTKIKSSKPPAHQWQELALQIIEELRIPNFKRSSVFKVCRDNNKQFVLNCLTDTKELCKEGEAWKYFFKVVGGKGGIKN